MIGRLVEHRVPLSVAIGPIEPSANLPRVSSRRLWKSVQFGLLRELLGGYEFARRIHFVAMAALLGFVVLHLVMVALVPRSLLAMLGGRAGDTR